MRLPALRIVAIAPLALAQLATSAKSFEYNPILGSTRLNRLGLHAGRVALAHRLAERRRGRLAALVSDADRQAYERNGFVVRHDFLPRAVFDTLAAEIAAYRGPLREKYEGDTLIRMVRARDSGGRIPALGALERSHEFQGLMRFIGSRDARPNISVQSVFSQVGPASCDPQRHLHADTFHPTVKAWLFIQDVGPTDGPFTYVPGSHRLTPCRLEWERATSLAAARSPESETRAGSFRITPAELTDLGLPQPVAFAVPANTLIVADTFGFHARGASQGRSRRIEVWAACRRNPFVGWERLDRAMAAVGTIGLTPPDERIVEGASLCEL